MENTISFENETFKPIFLRGERTNYAVSDTGSVINYKRQKRLKPSLDRKGYPVVQLSLGDGNLFTSVHRLVALAFIPNPDGLDTVNHINECKTDNSVSNLEWMSRVDNVLYSIPKTFRFINPEGVLVEIHNLNKFCKENELNVGNMHSVHSGRKSVCKGWRKA